MSKAVEVSPTDRSMPVMRATVPTKDELIERWGSIIRWPELRYVRLPFKRWEVNVMCGSCKVWRFVPVYVRNPTDGVLNVDCLRNPQHSYLTFGGVTGLCNSCQTRIARPNVEHPDGTKLFRSERNKDGLPVFCGACRKRGFLKCVLSETLHDNHHRCPSCKQILGKWLHQESGATVYWLKRKEDYRNYVQFDCAKCKDSFYCKDDLPPRAEWWGLCPDCRREHNPQRITENKPLPFSDKEIQYDKRQGEGYRPGDPILVPCPFPGCGKTNTFHFETTRRPGFTGLCKPGKGGHRRDEIALYYQSLLASGGIQQSGHKNGSPERRGPKPKPSKLTATMDVICELWNETGSIGEITYEEIASKLQLRGDNIGAKAVAQRFDRAGYCGEREDVVVRILKERGKL